MQIAFEIDLTITSELILLYNKILRLIFCYWPQIWCMKIVWVYDLSNQFVCPLACAIIAFNHSIFHDYALKSVLLLGDIWVNSNFKTLINSAVCNLNQLQVFIILLDLIWLESVRSWENKQMFWNIECKFKCKITKFM